MGEREHKGTVSSDENTILLTFGGNMGKRVRDEIIKLRGENRELQIEVEGYRYELMEMGEW